MSLSSKYISTVLLRPTPSEPELSLYDMGGAKQLLKISDAAVVTLLARWA